MDRKAVAGETLEIMRRGFYVYEGTRIDVREAMEYSIAHSCLITPEKGAELLEKYERAEASDGSRRDGEQSANGASFSLADGFSMVENISTVDAVERLAGEGREMIGVLNFASAKNPGGGFLNGAMAQEESLAASSTLYRTLTAHEEYYRKNRAQSSMMYTDYGIYSPEVLFFRDGRFCLIGKPVKASVLTLPAVNMGQVLQKGEDVTMAERVMRRRMKLALAIFAEHGARHLVLGAYGCGVFRNDPEKVAGWWNELLKEGLAKYFDSVFYAVLDRSRNQDCITAFLKVFGLSGAWIAST